MKYLINWTRTEYGQSWVEAKTEHEARELAKRRQDQDFENTSTDDHDFIADGWAIESIEKEGD